MFLFSQLLLTSLVQGQQQSGNPNCMVLQNSQNCPNQNGLVISTTSQYSNTAQFDQFVSSRLDSNPLYVQAFQKDFGCPEYQGQGQQYHISIYCALLTQKPSSCNGQSDTAQRVPLCRETCNLASSSLSRLFNTVCVSNRTSLAMQERSATISFYDNFCTQLPNQSSNQNQCLNGSNQPQESQTCGFPTFAEGQSFCNGNNNSTVANQCCPALSQQRSNGFNSSALFISLLVIGIIVFVVALFYFFRWAMLKKREADSKLAQQVNESMISDKQVAYVSAPPSILLSPTKDMKPLSSDARLSQTNSNRMSQMPPSKNRMSYIVPPQTNSMLSNTNNMSMPDRASGNVATPLGAKTESLQIPNTAQDTARMSQMTDINRFSHITGQMVSQYGMQAAPSSETGTNSAIVGGAAAIAGVATVSAITTQHHDARASVLRHSKVPQTLAIVAPYVARMPDEMTLNVGDMIQLTESYDDGWAYGSKIGTEEAGTFPLVCCAMEPQQ